MRSLVWGDPCAQCGEPNALLLCEPCGRRWYCTRECQMAHKKLGDHKHECKRLQSKEATRLRTVVRGSTVLALCSFLVRFVGSVVCNTGGYELAAQLLLCGLGLNYIMAFKSMRGQILGLVGSNGVLPCADELGEIRRACEAHAGKDALPRERTRVEPGGGGPRGGGDSPIKSFLDQLLLLTLDPALRRGSEWSDAFLVRLCDGGIVGGCALVVAQFQPARGLQAAQLPLMLSLWWAYYVIRRLTKSFTGLQWDVLLLEYGAVALPLGIPFVPPRVLVLAVFPLLMVAVKLMFSAGAAKRGSKCPKWASLTAMCYHYESQPLTHALSWYFHALPVTVHRLSCFAALAIEGPVCFLAFGPAPCRAMAFVCFASLMALIAASGHYGFFNYCAMALSIALLQDEQILQCPGAISAPMLVRRIDSSSLDGPDGRFLCLFTAAAPFLLLAALRTLRISGTTGYVLTAVHPARAWRTLRSLRSLGGEAKFATPPSYGDRVSQHLVLACYSWAGGWIVLFLARSNFPRSIDVLLGIGATAVLLVVAPALITAVSYPLLRLHLSRRSTEALPRWVEVLHQMLEPVSIGSSYNLMARMTTLRGEIVLRGSVDGTTWKEYILESKVQAQAQAKTQPWFVQPCYMPRLDWRLSNKRMSLDLMRGGPTPGWFDSLIEQILAGSRDVLGLLGRDPFQDAKERPTRIQVQIYEYRFVNSRNVAEGFMRDYGDIAWEPGITWQRRLVKTIKMYHAEGAGADGVGDDPTDDCPCNSTTAL